MIIIISISNYEHSTEITEDSMTTEIDAFFPRLLIEGLYKGEGRYSTFKVNAKGYFNVSMSKPNIFFIFSPI